MWTQAQNGVCPPTHPSGPWGNWCDTVINVNGKQFPEDRYNCIKAGGMAGKDDSGKPKCFMPANVRLSTTGQVANTNDSGGGVPMWAMALGGVAVVGAAYYFLLYKK